MLLTFKWWTLDQVLDDPGVEMFIVRDSDSRLTPRDAATVTDWLKQGPNYTFHCIRDHPSHSHFPISGGLWGGRRAALAGLFGGRYLLCVYSFLLFTTRTLRS